MLSQHACQRRHRPARHALLIGVDMSGTADSTMESIKTTPPKRPAPCIYAHLLSNILPDDLSCEKIFRNRSLVPSSSILNSMFMYGVSEASEASMLISTQPTFMRDTHVIVIGQAVLGSLCFTVLRKDWMSTNGLRPQSIDLRPRLQD